MSRAIDKIIGLQRLTARPASRSNSVLKSRSYAWIAPGREATNWSGSRSHSRMLMTDSGKFIRPAPMEGHGVYNRSSRVQAAGLSPAVPLLEQAARTVALPAEAQPVVIVDYGSSEGHNSLGPMALAIGLLRERVGPERAISVVHTDLPENDFSALFRTLATDPNSYLRLDPAVFTSAIGRSFYEQILPASSVTLAWSSWAVQWLSRVPAPIPDQVQVAHSRDPAACAAFSMQAALDWRTFLTVRSRELRPSGRLVVLTMAVDQAGDFGYRPLLEAIYAALMELVEEGFVRAEEGRRMVIPTVRRGPRGSPRAVWQGRALRGPFDRGDGGVPRRGSNLDSIPGRR